MSRLAHPEFVEVPPGLVFPRVITGRFEGHPNTDAVMKLVNKEPMPYDGSLTAEWNDEARAYQVVRLEVWPRSHSRPVTSSGLRALRVEELMQTLVGKAVRTSAGDTLPYLVPSARLNDRPDDERLLVAARTYVMARASADPPLKAVADQFRVSQSTATRLVARARAAGLVD